MIYRATVANTATGVISIIISVCVVGKGELLGEGELCAVCCVLCAVR